MSSYDEMLQKDTLLLWSILDSIRSLPWLESTFAKIISKKPWQDIVLILWLIFGIGLFEVGSPHLWVVSINFIFALGEKELSNKAPTDTILSTS
jgi:hypothetical protein